MLRIEIVVGQCSPAELSATGEYLTKLSQVTNPANADKMAYNVALKAARDSLHGRTEGPTPSEVLALKPAVALAAAQPEPVEPIKQDEYLAGIGRVPAPPFPHGEGFEDPDSSAAAPTLADQARATFGDAVVQGAHAGQARANAVAAVADPAFAAFAQQAALPNVAPSTAAVIPIVTAPAAPPANSAPNDSTPVVPPVPPVPAAPTVAPASSANVDKIGMPWDERIHAGTKAKNADGTWRTKRGVDQGLLATVTAELKQLMAAGPIEKPWPFAATAVPNVTPPPPAPPTIQMIAQAGTPAFATPEAAVAKLASAATFADLMASIPDLIAVTPMTFVHVTAACTELGLPNGVQGLHQRADLIPQLVSKLLAVVQS